MRLIIVLVVLSSLLVLQGCSGNQAEQLFETAQLEELQGALDHSRQLYQEIIDKYPESEYAKQAKERLSALEEDK